MALLLGVLTLVGQLVSVVDFELAQRLELQEKSTHPGALFSRLDRNTPSDITVLWTAVPVAILMLAGHSWWPWLAVAAGGIHLDTGGSCTDPRGGAPVDSQVSARYSAQASGQRSTAPPCESVRLTDDEHGASGFVRNAFAHASDRPDALQRAAPDDQQVGAFRCGNESFDRFLLRELDRGVGARGTSSGIKLDVVVVFGDDEAKRRVQPACKRGRDGSSSCSVLAPVNTAHDGAWKPWS